MEVYLIIEVHLVFQVCVSPKKKKVSCYMKTKVKAAINIAYYHLVKSLMLIGRILIFIKY